MSDHPKSASDGCEMLAAKIDLNKMAALSELVSQRVWAAILSKLQELILKRVALFSLRRVHLLS